MSSPRVAVLMCVFNSEPFLGPAIESILKQSYSDFEFLIINDCSTDKSKEIILSFNDDRIKLIENEKNIGLTRSLNKGISFSTGEYIARMDSDDISLENRLQKQVSFLDKNKTVGVCGSLFRFSDTGEIFHTEFEYEKIKVGLFRANQLAHPTVMFRKSFFKKFSLLYNEQLQFAQDYELWVRCCRYFPVVNLREALLIYSRHENQISSGKKKLQDEAADYARIMQLDFLGINPSQPEKEMHLSILKKEILPLDENLKLSDNWIRKLKSTNDNKMYFSKPSFNNLLRQLQKEIFMSYFNSRKNDLASLISFFCSTYQPWKLYSWIELLKFTFKCIVGFNNKKTELIND